MSATDFVTLLYASASITAGAFIGVLGNWMVSYKSKTNWKYIFYSLSALSFLLGAFYFFTYDSIKTIDLIGLSILIISSILLFFLTYIVLDKKTLFKTTELDPIINKFTDLSDRSEIKLFGGDLNFFGNSTTDMDKNNQYSHLKALKIRKVSILCEEPREGSTKIRYGKIMNELNGVELRYYDPDKADLSIRGRLLKNNGVVRLLIYEKIVSGIYKAIETDTANSNGALYNNIWDLTWSLAKVPTEKEKEEYVRLVKNGK